MVTSEDIREAQARLSGVTTRTRLIEFTSRVHGINGVPHVSPLLRDVGTPATESNRRLFLKPENQQPIGAFKLRGAYNKIASLSDDEKKRGVISYSSGNHAQGVAYSARALRVIAVF